MAPSFAAGHALTRWSNLPPDGFSLYYQHAAGLAGLAYFLAGLAVLRRTLSRHFSNGVVLATLVTITWGTNLFHYGVTAWCDVRSRAVQLWQRRSSVATMAGVAILAVLPQLAIYRQATGSWLIFPYYGHRGFTDTLVCSPSFSRRFSPGRPNSRGGSASSPRELRAR